MMGDSHMRTLAHYYSHYYNSTFIGEWGQKHTTISTTFYYYWIGLGWEFDPCVTGHTIDMSENHEAGSATSSSSSSSSGSSSSSSSRSSSSSKDVVMVVNNGAWDLWMGGVDLYLNDTAPSVIKTIRRLRQHHHWKDARIIYLTNFPYPVDYTHMGE